MSRLSKDTCTEDGCDDPSKARGLCGKHYGQHHRAGTLPPGGYLKTAEERYEKWIRRSTEADGCHLWTGATSSGYGVVSTAPREQDYVHRWVYMTFVGPIPDGLIVGHDCHDRDLTCPGGECIHRRCSRPDHLKLMTNGDNVRAGRAAQHTRQRGERRRAARTRCSHGHEMTPENLYIRPTDNAHICRECTREAKERYYAKNPDRAPKRQERDPNKCGKGHPYYVRRDGSKYCKTCASVAEKRYRERRKLGKAA